MAQEQTASPLWQLGRDNSIVDNSPHDHVAPTPVALLGQTRALKLN